MTGPNQPAPKGHTARAPARDPAVDATLPVFDVEFTPFNPGSIEHLCLVANLVVPAEPTGMAKRALLHKWREGFIL